MRRRLLGQSEPRQIFDEGARAAIQAASEEATRLGQGSVGPAHLLLGLLRDVGGPIGTLLASLGIDVTAARQGIEDSAGRGEDSPGRSLTPTVKRAVEGAVSEARRVGTTRVEPAHLLIGLLDAGEDPATGVLRAAGITADRVRRAIGVGQDSTPRSLAEYAAGEGA